MKPPLLRLHDGYGHTSPELTGVVRSVQILLRAKGIPVAVDGLFGAETARGVARFQRKCALEVDGIVGGETWAFLLARAGRRGTSGTATGYPRDHPLLTQDLRAAARYRPLIEAAAAAYGFSPAVIAGVGSRESRWGLAPVEEPALAVAGAPARAAPAAARPDDGADRDPSRDDLMRIAGRAGAPLARSDGWRTPGDNVRCGCDILARASAFLGRSTALEGRALLRGALAAYNAGPVHVVRAVRAGLDIDFFTAGRDYSRDVLDRAAFFRGHGWR